MKIKAQNIAKGTFEIEAQQNVIASKFSQIEDQRPVTSAMDGGLFLKGRNPSINLRSGDFTAGVRTNAVNSENINH